MKKSILRFSFGVFLLFVIGASVKKTNTQVDIGWGVATAIARGVDGQPGQVDLAGRAGATFGAAAIVAAYNGAEIGAGLGSLGGPIGAGVGALFGAL